MYFQVLRNGKPANSSCWQPKGKAFFQSTGHFRQVFSWISRNPGSSGLKTTGLQQSGAKLFGKRQDCSNPEPNSSGNGRIAAIRHFPDRTSRDFPNPRIPQTRLAPLHPPMKPRAAPDCKNPEPHHAPRPHLSAAAPMPAAAGRHEAKAQALPADGGKGISEAGFWRGKRRFSRTI